MSLKKLCGFCSAAGRRPAIGYTTHEVRTNVCERHFIIAAANGFLPKRFGINECSMTPDEAIATLKERSGEQT